MFSPSYLLVPLLLASYVSAHGFVHQITVKGQTFTSARPSGQRSNKPSAIRQITDGSPVKGANNPAINCGPRAFIASDVAKVNAGDSLAFDWRGADLSKWPHNTGPLITYLADCGNTPCNKFDSAQAKWFKIDQQGKKPGSSQWVQEDLFQAKTVSVKIPSNVAPGNYLIRHEIVALHLAANRGGAEFYPSCAQLEITGSGTGKPTAAELVTFPGAYSDNDPGIVGNSFFSNAKYNFPGPPIAKLAGGGSDDGEPNDTPAPDSTTASPTSTVSGSKPTSTKGASNGNSGSGNSNNGGSSSSGPKKVCKAKGSKSAKAKAAAPTPDVHPRHMSRIMRGAAFDTRFAGSAHGVTA